jgi:hypothetical protein
MAPTSGFPSSNSAGEFSPVLRGIRTFSQSIPPRVSSRRCIGASLRRGRRSFFGEAAGDFRRRDLLHEKLCRDLTLCMSNDNCRCRRGIMSAVGVGRASAGRHHPRSSTSRRSRDRRLFDLAQPQSGGRLEDVISAAARNGVGSCALCHGLQRPNNRHAQRPPATGSLFTMSFGLPTVPTVALTTFGNAQIAAMGLACRMPGCAVCSVLPLRVSVSQAWRRLPQP